MNATSTLLPSVPALRTSLPVISNSEKRCFQACRRRHFFSYRLFKRPLLGTTPQRFGSLMKRGLGAWWLAAQAGADRLAAALAAVQSEDFVEPLDRVRAEELLTAYDVRWADAAIEVLAVDAGFETAIVNPETGATSRTFALGGTINVLVRLGDGRVVIVEHKTSSEDIGAGSDYWKRLRLDSQVSDYFVGARSLGVDVAGCLYDILGKPKLQLLEATPVDKRQYKKDGTLYASQRDRDETLDEFRLRLRAHLADNLDRYYQRGVVSRLEEDERDAAFDTWQTAREIRDADRFNRHPRNPNACVQWGATCEFFAVCAREADLDDPTRYRTVGRQEPTTPAPCAA
jgi:hypothetical protein